MVKKNIKGWGNVFENEVTEFFEVNQNTGLLSVGNGNSYGDTGIPAEALLIDKGLFIDEGYLNPSMTIKHYLNTHNKILFAIPGKSNVTLGGAVASDVHGKDGSWGGSFQNNIEELLVLTPNNQKIYCSRTNSPEIFWSTIGGYGLTGSIIGVKFKTDLKPKYKYFEKTITKGKGIDFLIKNFNQNVGQYSVGWIDLLSRDFNWVLENAEVVKRKRDFKLKKTDKESKYLTFPFIGSNKMNSMKMINSIFYFSKRNNSKSLNTIDKVLFPLSYLSDTRNISKNRKIIQIQFSLPFQYNSDLENLLSKLIYKQKPILCSIKKLSENESKLNLSFVQEGWAIAVDFPYEDFDFNEIRKFYKSLIEHEGKVYLAKDSTLLEKEFKEMYPNFKNWQKIVKKIDPAKIFQSGLSQRLGLKDW